MERVSMNTGHLLVKTARDYEKKEEWREAADAYNQAVGTVVHYLDLFLILILFVSCPNKKKACFQLIKNNSVNEESALDHIIHNSKKKAVMMENRSQGRIDVVEEEISTSQPSMEGSYALLSVEEDESERFNKFWGVVEPMMNRLSDTMEQSKEVTTHHRNTVDDKEQQRIKREMSSILESYFVFPQKKYEETLIYLPDAEDTFPDQSILSASTEKSLDTYKKQNDELKHNVQTLTAQIQELEKSNIAQFKNNVHREAQRILQTQEATMMTRSAIAPGTPRNTRNTASPTELITRIKELEIENRSLRSQNKKQENLMNKYIERWESLKESAKKRQPI
ncbi:hypothetical protein BDB01DRAFT_833528 [Pilobolus umbonatus]|nr:hypothetical protein BDB01DRAFT_833528 [Pilobolus umbonatus]